MSASARPLPSPRPAVRPPISLQARQARARHGLPAPPANRTPPPPLPTPQVVLSVANVGDGIVDSSLYLDYVTVGRVCIRPLRATWFTDTVIHCFIDAITATRKYDSDGVGAELFPYAPKTFCREITGAGAKAVLIQANRIKPFYQPCAKTESWTRFFCKPPRYNLNDHNCCHFVDAALKVGERRGGRAGGVAGCNSAWGGLPGPLVGSPGLNWRPADAARAARPTRAAGGRVPFRHHLLPGLQPRPRHGRATRAVTRPGGKLPPARRPAAAACCGRRRLQLWR